MIELQAELVRIALGEVGVREVGGNNLGPEIRNYQKSTWLEPGPWPWCAAFTAWVLNEVLRMPAGSAYLSRRGNDGPEAFRCRDASAFGWLKWAGQRGLIMFDEHHPTLLPQEGDFVVYDFSHIGIVTGFDPINNAVRTVEGNTNGRGDRESESGDGVWTKIRAANLVRSYIRL